MDGLVSAAAADFVAKHSRPSASTGKSAGQSGIAMAFARQGAIGADAKATAAMADLGGFLEKPKAKAAIMAYEHNEQARVAPPVSIASSPQHLYCTGVRHGGTDIGARCAAPPETPSAQQAGPRL